MAYMTITQDKQREWIADAIVQREHEMAAYEMNILNYEIMLVELPDGEWPPDIARYRSVPLEVVAASAPADLEAVSQYQYRDRLRVLLGTEYAERNKARLVLDTLLMRLPDELVSTLVAAAAERRDTVIAAAQK